MGYITLSYFIHCKSTSSSNYLNCGFCFYNDSDNIFIICFYNFYCLLCTLL